MGWVLWTVEPHRTRRRPAFALVTAMWSPPPESNRRPHPYHESRAHRCADQRFCRSRPTVDRQGMCSSRTASWRAATPQRTGETFVAKLSGRQGATVAWWVSRPHEWLPRMARPALTKPRSGIVPRRRTVWPLAQPLPYRRVGRAGTSRLRETELLKRRGSSGTDHWRPLQLPGPWPWSVTGNMRFRLAGRRDGGWP
jgi:hypothetical protein